MNHGLVQHDVVVATHRRSGTHLMLTYVTDQFGLRPLKVHRFPTPTREDTPTVHVVRNPINVLWSTYRWFVKGQSANELIHAMLGGIDFAGYLRGEAGQRVGYRTMAKAGRDNFKDERGMLYDPIRFWADHVESYLEGSAASQPYTVGPYAGAAGSTMTVRYESLVATPQSELERVAGFLDIEMPDRFRPIGRDELVGYAPSPSAAHNALDEWSNASLQLLADRAGHVMARFGYEVPLPRTRVRRRALQQVRYVSSDDNSGYAVAGRRCVGAMAAVGLDVAWEPQPTSWGERGTPTSATPALLTDLYRPGSLCGATIMHTTPEWWAGLRRSLGRGHFTGHTMWDLDQFPDNWHGMAFDADELWVPTRWNRDTFANSGARQPVHVVPHVITTDPVHEPPIDIPTGVTVFATVASWHPRERPDLAVEAFARAFRRDDPVLLIVKTAAWTYSWPANDDLQRMTWWQLLQVLRRHPDAPHVMLVNDDFTDAQVNGLLARADCYVSLAASEAWGMVMFDAATLGTPVITTGFGGHLEYLGSDHPGLVPFRMDPIGPVENSPHSRPGAKWATPDLDAAAAMMRAIVEGTSPLLQAAPVLAERLHTTCSPAAVGALATTLLEEYL